MTHKFVPNNQIHYECVKCNYITANKKDFNKHNLTRKHLILTSDLPKIPENPNNKIFVCKCGNEYKHKQSLNNHKKKCTFIEHVTLDKDDDIKNLVFEVVKTNNELQKQNHEFQKQNQEIQKQNQEFQQQILDVCKNGINNNSNNVVNSHNKAFNLNVFLNETCKDAMDVNDFIDSFKLQLSDLDLVGKLGFVDGISSIIIKNLKALKVSERPVHCTDTKRETIYVKEQGIWEKQEDDHKKLRKIIKRVAFKNSKNLSLYKELHPDCTDYYSKHNDHYLKLRIEAFGGSGNETVDNENKIIKKIIKEMTIDKK
jgi:hypothetical protein